MKRISICLFFLLLFVGCSRERIITGEIFIVTQGGQNYKLGLVNIGLIQYEKLKQCIETKVNEANDNIRPIYNNYQQLKDSISLLTSLSDQYDKEISNLPDESLSGVNKKLAILYKARLVAYNKLRLLNKIAPFENIFLKYTSCEYFLSNLPKLDDSSKTDSEGRFSLTTQTNKKYFIVAAASRSIGEKKEYYYWMIEYSNPSFRENQKILLSNDNLLDPLTLLKLNNKETRNSTETKIKSAT